MNDLHCLFCRSIELLAGAGHRDCWLRVPAAWVDDAEVVISVGEQLEACRNGRAGWRWRCLVVGACRSKWPAFVRPSVSSVPPSSATSIMEETSAIRPGLLFA